MSMYIIDKNALYGEAMLPDMDPYNEADSTVVKKMEELYRARLHTALEDQGYTWFPETSELGQERGPDDGPTEFDAEDLRDMFRELSEEIFSSIAAMDDGELETAYSAEC